MKTGELIHEEKLKTGRLWYMKTGEPGYMKKLKAGEVGT